ncbi:gp018 [Rhodococcus phage ReqiDocB7]|uniref:gp018 n=1 Tax=Rhodococcus phage ReqiDocB7 TaxID=691966 RepID=UPI0001CDD754|nr:gp018 [Rhodococcus phage ReqiDocB7]ADD80804.1 gp018 [Rhodococcus phage ReqiDocB7]
MSDDLTKLDDRIAKLREELQEKKDARANAESEAFERHLRDEKLNEIKKLEAAIANEDAIAALVSRAGAKQEEPEPVSQKEQEEVKTPVANAQAISALAARASQTPEQKNEEEN